MKTFSFLFGGIFCFLYFCIVAKGFELPSPPSINIGENMSLTEVFDLLEKESKQIINQVIKMALPSVMEYSEKVNVSAKCSRDAMHIMYGIRNLKTWAIEFVDSSGKIPDGVMSGSLLTPGAYDECVDIKVKSTKKTDMGDTLFVGQYCIIEMRLKSLHVKKPPAHRMFTYPEELKEIMASDTIVGHLAQYVYYMDMGGIRIAVCAPSGCKKNDINSFLQTFTDGTPLNVTAISCEVKQEDEYTAIVISVIALYAIIIFVVVASSVLDYYSVCNKLTFKNKAIRCFLAFSLYSNFRKLYEINPKSTNIRCLNGVKFLGITWIFLGHTAITLLTPLSNGLFKIRDYTEELSFQAIVNATFSVDTFFFTGSFLVGYLTIKIFKVEGKKFNVWMYIIHRLWRIYPAYLITLSLSAVVPMMGAGPTWTETTGKMLEFCKNNWWASVLFVNNIYNPTESCWPHTWYITVDTQLYILALIFIIPLIKWPKVGISMVFLGMIASILWCGIATYVNDYPPTVLFSLMDLDESLDYFYYFYYAPMTHLAPYVLGILVGYFYAVNPNYKMSRMMVVLGWCFGAICCLSTLYGSIGWYRGEMPYYLLIMYASFSRITWQLGVAWMVFACITGNGGIINSILSWRVFVTLGRLSYSAYLLHLLVMIVFYGSFKTRLQPDIYVHIWLWAGHICASYGLAVILFLFVEVPFGNLERILLFDRLKNQEDSRSEKNIVIEGLKTSEKNGDIIIITPSINYNSNKI